MLKDLVYFENHVSVRNIHLIIARLGFDLDKGHYHNTSKFHVITFKVKTGPLKFAT